MTQENLIQEEQARQQREKVLQRSEAELHALIETIPHGIENIDLSGTITFANSALHKMYEHGEGQLLGTSILDHVAEEPEREKLQAFLQDLVKEQPAPAQYLGKKRTKKGRVIHVQVVWNYRRDEQVSCRFCFLTSHGLHFGYYGHHQRERASGAAQSLQQGT